MSSGPAIFEREIDDVPVEIPRGAVFRLLGMGRRRREPRASVLRLLDEELEIAAGLLEPRAVLGRSPAGLPGSCFLDRSLPHAVAVCTIGARIEERSGELAQRGSVTRATILDAIGSAAVEAVADAVNARICDRARSRGERPAPRRSPGYGGWKLEEQLLLFRALDPGELGVRLSGRLMMTPCKSISFAVPLGGEEAGTDRRNRCARCGMESCEYREETP